ncbi:hypothetical protein SAMN05660649_05097 [Desulfotomaculum arcticum]|uniref:Sulfatase N-terminal domain-containing protein n=1 Tax=Desulfotruncus arcticus DSM 17038 TaxID=1121424 RepID=A0A1I2ZS31_9FIRM|nr:hypothetical protein [Desulfotruncus arcticus]SFH40692.1 hypothetical protein SAMN05660649_05097 [Desulfotomaculum arcticum] [Desulfotruncus arcticus DSM 17038]
MSGQSPDSRIYDTLLGNKPNILIIMVDQQRYPVIYENEELQAWSRKYLKAQGILKSRGLEFRSHYAGQGSTRRAFAGAV